MVEYWLSETTARIDGCTFLSITWVSVALSLFFLIARVVVRIRYSRRLFLDDGLLIFSWAALVVQAILWTLWANTLYAELAVRAGVLAASASLTNATSTLLRGQAIVTCMFFLCLWLVKLSMMAFFRRSKAGASRKFKFWWWTVVCMVVLSFVATLADEQFQCIVHDMAWAKAHCSTPLEMNMPSIALILNCCLDIATNLMILSFPILCLRRNDKIESRRKCVFLPLLCLLAMVISFSAVRIADINIYQPSGLPWLWLWGFLECGFAIILASLSCFYSLYGDEILSGTSRDIERSYSVSDHKTARSCSLDPAALTPPSPAAHFLNNKISTRDFSSPNPFTTPQSSPPQPSKARTSSNASTNTYEMHHTPHSVQSGHNHPTSTVASMINLDEVPLFVNPNATDRGRDIFAARAAMPSFLQETYASWGGGPAVPRT